MFTLATMGAAGPATLPLMIVGAAGVACAAVSGAAHLTYKGFKAVGNFFNRKRDERKARKEGQAYQKLQEQARARIEERAKNKKEGMSAEARSVPTMRSGKAASMRSQLEGGMKTRPTGKIRAPAAKVVGARKKISIV